MDSCITIRPDNPPIAHQSRTLNGPLAPPLSFGVASHGPSSELLSGSSPRISNIWQYKNPCWNGQTTNHSALSFHLSRVATTSTSSYTQFSSTMRSKSGRKINHKLPETSALKSARKFRAKCAAQRQELEVWSLVKVPWPLIPSTYFLITRC